MSAKNKDVPMSIEVAIAILHPDTSREAINEYCYFTNQDDKLEVVNQACLLACKIMKERLNNAKTTT